MSDYHSIIIGAGSGGLTLATGLTAFGKKVALVERAAVGGDCTNVGCIPSKALLYAAAQPAGRSPREILAEVRQRRDALRAEETTWVEEMAGLDFIRGTARFLDDHSIEVQSADQASQRLSAQHIIITTGSSARVIPIEGLPAEKLLTNDDIFELETPPEHLVIIGGGVIAIELAFAFAKLGTQVTMLVRSSTLSGFSDEAAELIATSLRTNGVQLRTTVTAQRYLKGQLELSDGSFITEVDYVLQAIGRVPSLELLGLENTNLHYDKYGIPVSASGASNLKNIHAIGDVTHSSNFTHSANDQGRRLVMRLALPFVPAFLTRREKQPDYPAVIFSEPEVAQAGKTLRQLQEIYHPDLIVSYRCDLAETDRAYTMELEQGFITIHAMRLTGRVLASEIVAPNAGEMLPLLTFAISNRQSMYKLSHLIYPYPILSEAIKKAADAFIFATLPKLHKEIAIYMRYRWRSLAVVRCCADMFRKLLA